MIPRIEVLQEKKLVGKRLTMSLANNKTPELWRSFMPRKKEIQHHVDALLYSISIYDVSYFTNFNPNNQFEKWAALEVTDFETLPPDMNQVVVPGGMYAVFSYKGSSADNSIFEYIFGVWLPGSTFLLDDRPHFEVLGDRYKNRDANSEEQIWIPIKLRN